MITLEIPAGLPSIPTRCPFDWRLFPNAALEIKRHLANEARADLAIANVQAELANRYAARGELRGEKAVGTALNRILRGGV